MNSFFNAVSENPIIAALNNMEKLDEIIESPCKVVFLLTGDILNLGPTVDILKKNDKIVFVHLDLMEGFSRDVIAMKFIYEYIGLDGIITTKASIVKAAKELGIFTIQRLFILDSLALVSGIGSIRSIKPDAVEILPGIMPKVTKEVHNSTKIPIITGGLIRDKEDVIESLKAGAIAISTSNKGVWYM
jgi:glycerol uptake operon antiterminator